METSTRAHGAWRVLSVNGAVTLPEGPTLRDALLRVLAGETDGVIVDLSGVSVLEPACLAFFAAGHWSAPWPWPTVWLAGARGAAADTVERVGGGRHVAVAPTVDDALAEASTRPPLSRVSLNADGSRLAPRRARAFVAKVCERWGLAHVGEAAVLVTSELVANAAVHAGTGLELRAEHGFGLLKLAVRDHSPEVSPTLWVDHDEDLLRETGRGLPLVRALATSVGGCVHPEGKTIWAALDVSNGAPDERPSLTDEASPRSGRGRGYAAGSPAPAAYPLGPDREPRRQNGMLANGEL